MVGFAFSTAGCSPISRNRPNRMNAPVPVRGRQLGTTRRMAFHGLAARVCEPFLSRFDQGLEAGTIEAVLPDGSCRILGGRGTGPVARIDFLRWRALLRVALGGSVGFYNAWADGDWRSADLVSVFDLTTRNRITLGATARASGLAALLRRVNHWRRRNSRAGAKRNILAHYDLGNDFYQTWLDETMSYSGAVFGEPVSADESLEAAQRRKVAALLDRLELRPESDILEIGCGWGYLANHCASLGHHVTAITLSPSQKLWAERAAKGLATPPDYQLRDYRDMSGSHDAIISVEMVEAVGQAYWPAYLDTIARCLKPGGRAAIQFISIADDIFPAYEKGADFIQTYVFPGGMLLSESRFRALAEARGLRWEYPFHLPLHYAETLLRWRNRFDRAVDEGRLPPGFDQRFANLWRYYLQYCEGGFRGGGVNVAQVTLVKPDVGDVG